MFPESGDSSIDMSSLQDNSLSNYGPVGEAQHRMG